MKRFFSFPQAFTFEVAPLILKLLMVLLYKFFENLRAISRWYVVINMLI